MARNYKIISMSERKTIEQMYLAGDRPANIAKSLGVHTATIYHELKRGATGNLDINQRPEYCPQTAQRNLMRSLRNRGRRAANQ